MLKDYRDWLDSELKLAGNATHHGYAFGQANMAKRALERLDDELAVTLYVPLDRAEPRAGDDRGGEGPADLHHGVRRHHRRAHSFGRLRTDVRRGAKSEVAARAAARRVVTALEALAQQGTALPPDLEPLRDAIMVALEEVGESSAI